MPISFLEFSESSASIVSVAEISSESRSFETRCVTVFETKRNEESRMPSRFVGLVSNRGGEF